MKLRSRLHYVGKWESLAVHYNCKCADFQAKKIFTKCMHVLFRLDGNAFCPKMSVPAGHHLTKCARTLSLQEGIAPVIYILWPFDLQIHILIRADPRRLHKSALAEQSASRRHHSPRRIYIFYANRLSRPGGLFLRLGNICALCVWVFARDSLWRCHLHVGIVRAGSRCVGTWPTYIGVPRSIRRLQSLQRHYIIERECRPEFYTSVFCWLPFFPCVIATRHSFDAFVHYFYVHSL